MASIVSRFGLDAARAAFFEKLYAGKSVLCVGLGDGAALEVILGRGAARVAGVDIDEDAVTRARERTGGRAALKTGPVREALVLGAPFDVVLVRRGETMVARDLWREVSRMVKPGGWLVAAALAGDHGDAPHGAMRYQQLRDHLAAYFPNVTMLAQSSFAGAAVIPFGDAEVEPVLDTGLAGPPVPYLYVAAAGPEALTLPYGLVELPDSDIERAPLPAASERPAALADREERTDATAEERSHLQALSATLRERETRLERIEEERRGLVARLEQRTGAGGVALGELREQLAVAEHALEEARNAALVHAADMRSAQAVLGERDAFIAEMEQEVRAVERLRDAARSASLRAEQADANERAARRRVAELEGEVLRLRGGEPVAGTAAAPGGIDEAAAGELSNKVAELETRCARLQQKADDAQREAWGHMKARSEAEAAAAEVREDTVRKLKDARKIANVELMRAMEEATRKAVTLKEELVRTERERKEALAALHAAHAELEAARKQGAEQARLAASEELNQQLAGIESALAVETRRVASLEDRLRRTIDDLGASGADQAGGGSGAV